MEEALASFPWGAIGAISPAGMLMFAVWLVLTGRMVPRKTYEDKVQECGEWKAAHKISEIERLEQARQITKLLEVGSTVNSVMRALESRTEQQEDRSEK